MKRFAKMNLSTASQGVSLYLSNFGRKIRNLFSNELKNFESMKALKNRIKNSKPDNFPCRVFRFYSSNIGFI